MIRAKVEGVEFIAANTDLQALKLSQAPVKLQLGGKLTKGLGAGANPEIGRKAALEDTDKIIEALEGSDMIFLTVWRRYGQRAAPVVASLASELGALLLRSSPSRFCLKASAGSSRRAGARGVDRSVDTVIVIPNERLLETVEAGTSFFEAFRIADDVLRQAVQGISDIITIPGIVNRDFADVRTIMQGRIRRDGDRRGFRSKPLGRCRDARHQQPAAGGQFDSGRAGHPDQHLRIVQPHAHRSPRSFFRH